jgi:hypothetical protein
MALETTPAYVTKVGSDHTIVLPDEMPIGATVAIIVVPTGAASGDDAARRARFAETLAAIRAASAGRPQPAISDGELDALIEKARKAPRA